ncbi:MAG: C39 family peptidase [Candidatus Diapherotrites archaeon]
MDFDALFNLSDYTQILGNPVFGQLVFAIGAIFLGIILAKIFGRAMKFFGKNFQIGSGKTIRSFQRMFEWFIFFLSIILALNFLGFNAAQDIFIGLLNISPNIISLLLLMFVGFILINLLVDILRTALLRIGFDEYLDEAGISVGVFNNILVIVKIFLFLILFSVSLNLVNMSVPFIDQILIAITYGFVLLSVALIYYVSKDLLANFFAGIYLERKLIKPGQTIKVKDEAGEVIGMTSQGVLLRLPTGFNLLIPSSELINERIYIKRTKQDILRLENIRTNFVAQIPAYCGPASASMMLSFFGFDTTQEEVGKFANTKVPGGTGPKKLIAAVSKATNNQIKGVLVRYDEINDLKEELKTWLAEGALLILWFNKPALFKTSKGRGHYVLCVGVEGDELVIMDPSKSTAGVYLVDFRLLEDAMSEIDKKRGYLVFAIKGSSAHWRLSEGLIYSDVSAYKELSKSFERYLRKLIRKNETINDLLSEHVFNALEGEKRVKRIWKPEKKAKKSFE